MDWFREKDSEISHWFNNNYVLFSDDFEEWEEGIFSEDDSDEEFHVGDFLRGYGLEFHE